MNAEKRRDSRGFTLIEIVAGLVLLGIIGAGGAYAIAKAVESYAFNRDNSEIMQKAQLALDRMTRELTFLDTTQTVTGTANSIIFTAEYPDGTSENHTFLLSGTEIQLDGNTLIDGLSSNNGLQFEYLDGFQETPETTYDGSSTNMVAITLTVLAADDVEKKFETRVRLGKLN